jgi:hypothetical protein
MKEIIVITSYTPDKRRRDSLRNLVISLKRGGYDILVISHSPIPTDIQENVEFVIYDKKNEILTEAKYLPQPWFTPNNDRRIQSALVGLARSTHLTIWRMISIAFPFVKNIGYDIIHHIEYDSYIENFQEFKENVELLRENDAVLYINEKYFNGNWINPIILGNFQSLKVSSLPDLFTKLNEEKILKMIEESPSKSCENMFGDEISKDKKVIRKNVSSLKEGGNLIGLSDEWAEDYHPWAVPFYDRLTSKLGFIFWNQKDKIANLDIITNFGSQSLKVSPGIWHLLDLGNFEEIEYIITVIDGKVRNHIDFKNDSREWFMDISWRHESK